MALWRNATTIVPFCDGITSLVRGRCRSEGDRVADGPHAVRDSLTFKASRVLCGYHASARGGTAIRSGSYGDGRQSTVKCTTHKAQGTNKALDATDCSLQERSGPLTSNANPPNDSVPSYINECSRT